MPATALKITNASVNIPEDVPLKITQIKNLGLLGPIGYWGIRKILLNPANGFTRIKCGGTDKSPYYGVTIADIQRYWKMKRFS